MVERGRQQGYTFSQPDLFIAADRLNSRSLRGDKKCEGILKKLKVPVFNPFSLR